MGKPHSVEVQDKHGQKQEVVKSGVPFDLVVPKGWGDRPYFVFYIVGDTGAFETLRGDGVRKWQEIKRPDLALTVGEPTQVEFRCYVDKRGSWGGPGEQDVDFINSVVVLVEP